MKNEYSLYEWDERSISFIIFLIIELKKILKRSVITKSVYIYISKI